MEFFSFWNNEKSHINLLCFNWTCMWCVYNLMLCNFVFCSLWQLQKSQLKPEVHNFDSNYLFWHDVTVFSWITSTLQQHKITTFQVLCLMLFLLLPVTEIPLFLALRFDPVRSRINSPIWHLASMLPSRYIFQLVSTEYTKSTKTTIPLPSTTVFWVFLSASPQRTQCSGCWQ